jgi:uncharacterized membrane protein
MNLKRIFGSILTTLGIISLLYGAYHFINTKISTDWKTFVVSVVLGLIFFSAGIGLIKGTDDKN